MTDGNRPIRVLFVCTGNSARSQMAEAILGRLGGPDFEVHSAGTHPGSVNPLTIRALSEIGIDWPDARSKSVSEYLDQPFDYVVTVCDQAREACPVFPGGRVSLHWGFDDPATARGTDDEQRAVFRRVRDEISAQVTPFADRARQAGPHEDAARPPARLSVELGLLRHAHAGDPESWDRPDELRPLSDKGRQQAERLGRLLAAAGFAPDAVLTSPLVRARETAEIVADRLGISVRVDPRLATYLDLAAVDAILDEAGTPVRAILVGHDPDFSDLLVSLTGSPGLRMRKGAFALLDVERPLAPGSAELRWLVPPDLLRR